jgi:hypothetical protein
MKKKQYKWSNLASVGCGVMFLFSCVPVKQFDYSERYIKSLKIGHFDNLYQGCAILAGVEAHQLPVVDNAVEDYSDYIGKHPGTIDYHFWDGRICSVRYSPDGKILKREWSQHSPASDADGYTSWEGVDFSKGSDPEFRHHKDPRNRVSSERHTPTNGID